MHRKIFFVLALVIAAVRSEEEEQKDVFKQPSSYELGLYEDHPYERVHAATNGKEIILLEYKDNILNVKKLKHDLGEKSYEPRKAVHLATRREDKDLFVASSDTIKSEKKVAAESSSEHNLINDDNPRSKQRILRKNGPLRSINTNQHQMQFFPHELQALGVLPYTGLRQQQMYMPLANDLLLQQDMFSPFQNLLQFQEQPRDQIGAPFNNAPQHLTPSLSIIGAQQPLTNGILSELQSLFQRGSNSQRDTPDQHLHQTGPNFYQHVPQLVPQSHISQDIPQNQHHPVPQGIPGESSYFSQGTPGRQQYVPQPHFVGGPQNHHRHLSQGVPGENPYFTQGQQYVPQSHSVGVSQIHHQPLPQGIPGESTYFPQGTPGRQQYVPHVFLPINTLFPHMNSGVGQETPQQVQGEIMRHRLPGGHNSQQQTPMIPYAYRQPTLHSPQQLVIQGHQNPHTQSPRTLNQISYPSFNVPQDQQHQLHNPVHYQSPRVNNNNQLQNLNVQQEHNPPSLNPSRYNQPRLNKTPQPQSPNDQQYQYPITPNIDPRQHSQNLHSQPHFTQRLNTRPRQFTQSSEVPMHQFQQMNQKPQSNRDSPEFHQRNRDFPHQVVQANQHPQSYGGPRDQFHEDNQVPHNQFVQAYDMPPHQVNQHPRGHQLPPTNEIPPRHISQPYNIPNSQYNQENDPSSVLAPHQQIPQQHRVVTKKLRKPKYDGTYQRHSSQPHQRAQEEKFHKHGMTKDSKDEVQAYSSHLDNHVKH